MKTIKLSEFPDKLSNGIRIMHDSDLRIDVETSEYWSRDTEAEYNKVTAELDKISAKGKGYVIYAWYDVSGFDYWVINMKEDNYAQITVQFDGPDFPVNRIPALERKLNKVIDKVNSVIYF